jgi:hypothetical protein
MITSLRIIGFLLVILVFCNACNSQKEENEKLHSEIIAVHDEVMPIMGDLKSLQNDFLERAETLYMKDKLGYQEEIASLRGTAADLDEAYNGMFVWMRQFETEHEGMKDEEITAYLLDQKEKVEKVNEDIKNVLERAEEIKKGWGTATSIP